MINPITIPSARGANPGSGMAVAVIGTLLKLKRPFPELLLARKLSRKTAVLTRTPSKSLGLTAESFAGVELRLGSEPSGAKSVIVIPANEKVFGPVFARPNKTKPAK